jgi:hypothetical protein
MSMDRFTPITLLPSATSVVTPASPLSEVARLPHNNTNNSNNGNGNTNPVAGGVVVGVPAPLTAREMEQLYLPMGMMHPSLVHMGVPTNASLVLPTAATGNGSVMVPVAVMKANRVSTASHTPSSSRHRHDHQQHQHDDRDDDSDGGSPPNSPHGGHEKSNIRSSSSSLLRRRQHRDNGSASDSDTSHHNNHAVTKSYTSPLAANASVSSSSSSSLMNESPRRTINGRVVKPRRNLGSRKRGTSCRAMYGRERENRDRWCQGCRNNWKCQRDLTDDEIVQSLRTYQRPKTPRSNTNGNGNGNGDDHDDGTHTIQTLHIHYLFNHCCSLYVMIINRWRRT